MAEKDKVALRKNSTAKSQTKKMKSSDSKVPFVSLPELHPDQTAPRCSSAERPNGPQQQVGKLEIEHFAPFRESLGVWKPQNVLFSTSGISVEMSCSRKTTKVGL